MLSRAEVLDGAATADKGVRTLCVATWRGAWLGMVTEYISFERGRVAAVKLARPMPFFGKFAATILHEPIFGERSSVTYIYSFGSRPGFLRFILDPLLKHRTLIFSPVYYVPNSLFQREIPMTAYWDVSIWTASAEYSPHDSPI